MDKYRIYLAAMAILLLAVTPLTLSASDNTTWCQAEQNACNTTCDGFPRTASVKFDCIDRGTGTASSPATRSVACQCLDASGNVISSTSTGAGGGATSITTGTSSTSTASSSATGGVGGRG